MSLEPYYRTGVSASHRDFLSPGTVHRKPVGSERPNKDSQFGTLEPRPYALDVSEQKSEPIDPTARKYVHPAHSFYRPRPTPIVNPEGKGEETPNKEGPGKKLVVVNDNEEYEMPDPKMYVTRVINPETEIKKRVMARELENALQEQIASKKMMKEEQKRTRIMEELQEEERWRKEREDLTRREAEQRKKALDRPEPEPEPAQQEQQQPCSPPSQAAQAQEPEFVAKPSPAVAQLHTFDVQLKQLRSEMLEKEKEFHGELEKLKQAAFDTSNARDAADRQLTQLKDHIMKKPEYPAVQTLSSFGYNRSNPPRYTPASYILSDTRHSAQTEKEGFNMGKYSRLYFTNYNKALSASAKAFSRDELLNKKRYHPKFAPETFLPGESRMLPWRQTEDLLADRSPNMKMRKEWTRPEVAAGSSNSLMKRAKDPAKTVCERLDDLMNEFLTHKSEEDTTKTLFPKKAAGKSNMKVGRDEYSNKYEGGDDDI